MKDKKWDYMQSLALEIRTGDNQRCCICGSKHKYQVMSKYFGEVCEDCILKAFDDARGKNDVA